MNSLFEIGSGSVTGSDHVAAGKNNHDAYHWISSGNMTIAVVSDGCGSGKQSEVGSKIGVRLVVESLACQVEKRSQHSQEAIQSPAWWERIRQDVLAQLRILANAMGESLSQTVSDYFLFTVVGVLIVPDGVTVFSIGDGVFAVNGEIRQLGPFPGNTPPYLAYGLVGSSIHDEHPELLQFQIQKQLRVETVDSLLIGTDGVSDLMNRASQKIPGKQESVGPLSQFWKENQYFLNPDAVRRKLTVINTESRKPDWELRRLVKEPALLPDDTTLIVLRKKVTANK